MNVVSIIAASTAPLTVICTMLTAFCARHQETKQKQIELYETRRLDAINSFSNTFAKLYNSTVTCDSVIREALAATYTVIPYSEPACREPLNALVCLLRTKANKQEIYDKFDECLGLISSANIQKGKIRLRLR